MTEATDRHAWIDASAGVAGDMLLGALVDAGADVAVVQRCIDAVVGDAVRLRTERVTRAGIAATKVHVDLMVADPPHRTWRTIRAMLADATLPEPVRDRATAVFARLAEAEAQVHGTSPEEIHFHEVGALDSIADIVGVCAALDDLGIKMITGSRVAVGSGTVRAAHGRIPVPVPAVTRLATGWEIMAGGDGELTTPTGMALVVTLCSACNDLPAMRIQTVGLGAGTKDFEGRANVTRILIGEPAAASAADDGDPAVLLEANVDDLDPRLWPGVLADLLAAGASDAWLVPISMKKGRPAHTLAVLAHPSVAGRLREMIFDRTSTIGVRQQDYRKFALPRAWVRIAIGDGPVMIKLAHRDGVIQQATPEFEDVHRLASAAGKSTRAVLSEAVAAAWSAGLRPGDHVPENAQSHRDSRPTTPSVSPEASSTPPTQEDRS